jgi:2-hydroxy-3-oxopropionate reductase
LNSCKIEEFSMRIGFIGLGTVGRPMLERLLRGGFDAKCCRIKKESAYLLDLGAENAETPADAAREADVIILMLPDTDDATLVLTGEGGVFETAKSGSVIIDMSSISPVATKELAQRAIKLGFSYLDAPVSGGEIGAREGLCRSWSEGTKNSTIACCRYSTISGRT